MKASPRLALLLLQIPFQEISPPSYLEMLDTVLHMVYALSVRGYVLFILGGMIVYTTSLSDGTAKWLIIVGLILHFLGPFAVTYLLNSIGLGPISSEKAESAWRNVFGVGDLDILTIVLMIGDALVAVSILAGAILHFTPSSNELKNKGQSLITRGIILAPVLLFFHATSFI